MSTTFAPPLASTVGVEKFYQRLEIGFGLFLHHHMRAVFEAAHMRVRQFVRHAPTDAGVVVLGHDQARLGGLVQVRNAVPILHRAGVAELVGSL